MRWLSKRRKLSPRVLTFLTSRLVASVRGLVSPAACQAEQLVVRDCNSPAQKTLVVTSDALERQLCGAVGETEP